MKPFPPLLVHVQDYDASQDDDASCFITGSLSATIFLPHQLPRARSLLSTAKEEDLVVIPETTTLKEEEEHLRQRVVDLSTEKRFIERKEEDINSSYCDLLCRISEYHKDILAKEEKARSLVMMATLEQLHAVRGEVMKVTELSKAVEKDSDMQIFLLDRMRLKLQSVEKQLEEEAGKLKDLSSRLADLEHARECNKLWINGLNEQIKLMGTGQGMTGCLVPMEQCKEAPTGSDAVLFIWPYPVCGKYFKQNAFCVISCGCMYHPFCLGAHLELFKCSTCVRSTCKEIFDDDMIKLFGYHQHRIELPKVKSTLDEEA
jgi:hypothetical protein